MGWFKKYRNRVGLPEAKVELLLKSLANLESYGADLRDDVVRYLLDDENEAVLEEVAGKENVAHALGLICGSQHFLAKPKFSWEEFLETIEQVDPGFYLRLAKLFEAAARKLPPDRFFCQPLFDGALWLEILLQEATRTAARSWSSHQPKCALNGAFIESLLGRDGRSVKPFVTAPFRELPGPRWNQSQARWMVLRIGMLGETFAAHRDLVAQFLCEGKAEQRLIALENLAVSQTPAEPFLAELVGCATDSSKQLREMAEGLLKAAAQAAQPLIEELAQRGDRTQREHAVRLLGRLGKATALPFLESLDATETSRPVREAIAATLQDARAGVAVVAGDQLVPPPRQPLPLQPPVTPALRAVLESLFAQYADYAAEHNAKLANPAQQKYIHPRTQLPALPSGALDRLCGQIEHGQVEQGRLSDTVAHCVRRRQSAGKGSLQAFLEHPDCELIHATRLLAALGLIGNPGDWHRALYYWGGHALDDFRRSHVPRITLDDVAEAVESLGLTVDAVIYTALTGYQRAFDWEPEAVWPFFIRHLPKLEQALEPAAGDWHSRWERVAEFKGTLRILAKFPQVPPALVGRLWDLALGTSKEQRAPAQKVAMKLPDVQERLALALTSGNYQTRLIAAEWLGRLGDRRAVEPLDRAARKEKQDAALDEILTALEKLGQPIEPYLDRAKLAADAAKGLKKGRPEALNWFPWDKLPKVHWQDTGEEVPTQIVEWLLVQNFKLKSAEPGPLLVRYCAMLQPDEREELGNFVLRAWLEQDLKRKYTDAECRAGAQQHAAQWWPRYQQWIQQYQQRGQAVPVIAQKTQQQLEEDHYRNLQREVGSAAAEKGLLAVAGACGSEAAVAPVQKYLKDWYGYRPAQCKALIAMLSGIDRPSAIQYLLSISNRFRTKGIREEAERYVSILAARKGWTLDELADRTMPTAGFDEDGRLELNFGPRQFVARVNPSLEVALADGEGKVLKALPAPRKDDDEELAKAAKKSFSAAKAELKKFSSLQAMRLYEAMCTERTWSVADWRTYLVGHPLLKFLCQRLVWSAQDGGAAIQTFRPLDDGSLTDAADNEVQLSASAKIRAAHGCQLPLAAATAWPKHLADYDVSPLFTQFGRPTYDLPAERRRETAIGDFQGHMVEAFKLRGMATKAGYTRGPTGDGGWFHTYEKFFPGISLKVHLEFSGNGLPEENRSVALVKLSFETTADKAEDSEPAAELRLGDVPAVLLTECYNDLAAIAAAGSGFDAEWEKKVY